MTLVRFQYEPVSLDINEACLEEEMNILIYVKNQWNVKALLNGVDVGNETWSTQMLTTWAAARLKLWDTFNYQIWYTMIGMLSPKELQHSCNFT